MLFLDGVYVTNGERLSLRRVPPPTGASLEKLVHGTSQRVGRVLERLGLLVRDFENSFLTLVRAEVSGFDDLLGNSITYRITLGPHQDRKAFTLQTVPAVAAARAKRRAFAVISRSKPVARNAAQMLDTFVVCAQISCYHREYPVSLQGAG